MAKAQGNNYQLWIESAVAGTYNLVKGQQGMTLTRSASKVDMSTKDDGGYGSTAPGLKTWSISGTVLPNLPDANGYTRLETQSNASPAAPINIQMRKGGSAGVSGDVVFAGAAYANLDSTDYAQNGAVPVKVTLDGVGAPTTDTYAV